MKNRNAFGKGFSTFRERQCFSGETSLAVLKATNCEFFGDNSALLIGSQPLSLQLNQHGTTNTAMSFSELVRFHGILLLLLIVSVASPARILPNQGQLADEQGNPIPEIRYYMPMSSGTVFFRADGFSYVLQESPEPESPEDMVRGHRIDFSFGIFHQPTLETLSPIPGYANFYLPHCPEGIHQVPAYGALRYKNVYPQIDLVLRLHEGQFKYDWVVKAGGNPDDIGLEVEGHSGLSLDALHQLHIRTTIGDVVESIPAAWVQYPGGEQVEANAEWVIDGNVLRINCLNRPTGEEELVIDPLSTWATYFGANSYDYGRGVALSGTSLYVTGETQSTNFPTTVGAFQSSLAGSRDAVAMRFTTGGALVWSTYYGGGSLDAGEAVDTDALGNIYVVGRTGAGFPTSAGAYQASPAGGVEAFLLKLDPTGARLWATYLAGESEDEAYGVAVDGSNDVVVTGHTLSNNNIASAGAVQTSRSGNEDGFVMKFNAIGTRLWGTYFGGSSLDKPLAVDTDSGNNIVITGETYGNFPVGACCGNSVQQAAEGGGFGDKDVFITKLNSDGSSRLWSTYYGGPNIERGFGITVDAADNVIVTGNSDGNGFPTTFGVLQPNWGGGGTWGNGDAILMKFAPNGTRTWATYYGGNDYDQGMAVYASGTNDIYMVGETASGWPSYGMDCGTICTGLFCGFLLHIDGNGANRVMGTTVGGSGTFNSVLGVVADNDANIYITGFTSSFNFPTGGTTVYQSAYGGGSSDGFVGLYNADSCNARVLPARDMQLTGVWENDEIQLAWAANRSPGDELWLEKSLDGVEFVDSEQLQGKAGTSSDPGLNGHVLFFRLRALSPNGEWNHSEVVCVEVKGEQELSVWNNQGILSIRFSGMEPSGIELIDLNGRVLRKARGGHAFVQMSTESLPQGVYVLRAIGKDGALTRRIWIGE